MTFGSTTPVILMASFLKAVRSTRSFLNGIGRRRHEQSQSSRQGFLVREDLRLIEVARDIRLDWLDGFGSDLRLKGMQFSGLGR